MRVFAKMDDESPASPDQSSDFEFFTIMLRNPWEKLRLPDKFAEFLDGQEPRAVKLREAGGGQRRLWDVEVVFDGKGQMYLERGWEQFAREHDVHQGHFLLFSYDGEAVLTVKVFDGSMCRRHYRYQHEDDEDASETPAAPLSSRLVTVKEEEASISPGSESNSDGGSSSKDSIGHTDGKNSNDCGSKKSTDGGSENSISSAEMDGIDDAPTPQFTVTLKNSNLESRQKQYLNVPPEFQKAHGYDRRSEVALRMRGRPWTVKLKHNVRAGGRTRASFRYGWHQFCVDNGLDVGDVCFFRALRGGGAEDHELKVEVRKLDGTFIN
uniref:Uncharacterized protein n=1 Tax=Avena sativa TaxID=4498 RepID=A0ACD5XI17_AVESA